MEPISGVTIFCGKPSPTRIDDHKTSERALVYYMNLWQHSRSSTVAVCDQLLCCYEVITGDLRRSGYPDNWEDLCVFADDEEK